MFRILSFVNTSFCFRFGYAFSARHLPPSRDCGLCHLSISCWFSPFVSPPRHDGSLREGFASGFPCLRACVLLQIRLSSSSPPRCADDTRAGFDGGWSCHSAFFVSPPRHTGGTRQVLTDGLPSYSVCVSFNCFLRVFLVSWPGRLEVWEWVLRRRKFDSWSS